VGRQLDQPRPHRRRTAGARFVPQRRLFYGGVGRQLDQPRPHRRRTAGARFVPSAVCSTAALGGAIRRGRHGVEQPVLGLPPSAVCFTAALGGAIRRGRHGVEQPVLGLPPSAVCFTAAWDGSSISRGRTGVEQPVPALLPAPSVPRQRGTAQTTGASFAPSAVCSTAARHGTNNRCQLYSQRRLFHGGAAQREQPVPALPPAPSVLRRRKPLILVSNPPGSYPAYPRGDVRPGQSVSWALPRFDRASGYADSSHPHGAVGLLS